jgi:hypothetical protein
MRLQSWAVVGAWAAVNGLACEHQNCTLANCSDGMSVSVVSQTGEWPSGDYTLDLSLDGLSGSCVFSMPADAPQPGSVARFDCGDEIEVSLGYLFECADGAIPPVCEPIPDQYELTFYQGWTPRTLQLSLSRDATVLVSEDRELSYVEETPNGRECGPVCRNASVELSFDE